jgi:hypothetical protein
MISLPLAGSLNMSACSQIEVKFMQNVLLLEGKMTWRGGLPAISGLPQTSIVDLIFFGGWGIFTVLR